MTETYDRQGEFMIIGIMSLLLLLILVEIEI